MEKSKTRKMQSLLLTFILMVAALWVSPAAAQKYVTDPTTGKVVSTPEYGGTLTQATKGYWKVFDTYLASPPIHVGGIVVEKLGMLDWGLDRP